MEQIFLEMKRAKTVDHIDIFISTAQGQHCIILLGRCFTYASAQLLTNEENNKCSTGPNPYRAKEDKGDMD